MKHAAEIHTHLQKLYGVQTWYERFVTSKELFQMRMGEGTSFHEHGLKMIGLIKKLSNLGIVTDNDFYVDLILQSLPKSFDQFVMNFNMEKNEVTINELVNMLVTAESTIKKDKPVILASTSKARKGAQKGKKKKSSSSKGK